MERALRMVIKTATTKLLPVPFILLLASARMAGVHRDLSSRFKNGPTIYHSGDTAYSKDMETRLTGPGTSR